MKIGIISDIHENFHNLLKALEVCEEREVGKIFCLGDLINPGIAKVLSESKIPVFCLWGNNDGDKVMILQFANAPGSNLEMAIHSYAFVEEGGRKGFITHFDDLARPMAKSGEFDFVFYGHNHEKKIERIQDCLIVNPGEVSGQLRGKATFGIYDSEKNSAEIIAIPDPISLRSEFTESYFSNQSN